MSEAEKRVAKTLADAIEKLSPTGKSYFIGFAEGVATMAQQLGGERQSPNEPPSQGDFQNSR